MPSIPERIPVLVVDDELAMRRLANEWLKHRGFEAIEAEDMHGALLALRVFPNLRLVVTDLQLKAGNARVLHEAAWRTIAERNGLFCVLSGAEMQDDRYIDPHLRPYVDYFREHGVTVFKKPVSWGDIISHLQVWLNVG